MPVVETEGPDHYPFLVGGEGVVEIEFGCEKHKPPFTEEAKRREWLRRLNEIPGVHIDEKSLGGFPTIPLEKLSAPGAYDAFLRATAIAELLNSTTS